MLPKLVATAALLFALAAPAHARCAARSNHDRAEAIAHHAWGKHHGEFAAGRRIAGRVFPSPGLASEADLAAKVQAILDGGAGEPIRSDRTKYWDAPTGTIVIFNSRARDCGTAFRPNQGRRYYDRQR